MDSLVINGGKELKGSITISGSKNSALPLLAAFILTKNEGILENVPNIIDVTTMLSIISHLGISHSFKCGKVSFDFNDCLFQDLMMDEVSKLRASYYLIPVLAFNLKEFKIRLPGGCSFSKRPIDIHLDVFSHFGLKCECLDNYLKIINEGIHGTTYNFKQKSVGATINAILLASVICEVSTLTNISLEPEVMCLIEYLGKCGVDMTLVNDTLVVQGTNKFKRCDHENIQDRIEAGTYILLGAMCGQNLKIKKVPYDDLKPLFWILNNLGVDYKYKYEVVTISKSEVKNSLTVNCGPHPSFPSDLLPILISYVGQYNQFHVLKDKVYPLRYRYIDELNKLNYNLDFRNESIIVFPHSLKYTNLELEVMDLRGGASIVLGALATKGKHLVKGYQHILRGYEDFIGKIQSIGGEIYEE